MGFELRNIPFIAVLLLHGCFFLTVGESRANKHVGLLRGERTIQIDGLRKKRGFQDIAFVSSRVYDALFQEDTQVWERRQLHSCDGSVGSIGCPGSLSMDSKFGKPSAGTPSDSSSSSIPSDHPTLESRTTNNASSIMASSNAGSSPVGALEIRAGSASGGNTSPTKTDMVRGTVGNGVGSDGLGAGFVIALISVGCVAGAALLVAGMVVARKSSIANRGLDSVWSDSDPKVFEDIPLDT